MIRRRQITQMSFKWKNKKKLYIDTIHKETFKKVIFIVQRSINYPPKTAAFLTFMQLGRIVQKMLLFMLGSMV